MPVSMAAVTHLARMARPPIRPFRHPADKDIKKPEESAMTDYPIDMTVTPEVEAFFDPATNTISYVVKDPNSPSCAVVDSVMALTPCRSLLDLTRPTSEPR